MAEPLTGLASRTLVSCPTCGKDVQWSGDISPWRPFCSERCRLLDLGAWLTEERGIPGDEVPATDTTTGADTPDVN